MKHYSAPRVHNSYSAPTIFVTFINSMYTHYVHIDLQQQKLTLKHGA
jgi:hypothetical protein